MHDLNRLGALISDKMAGFVGTWHFVLIYTAVILLWIFGHRIGVLTIDGPDYVHGNLVLAYFAGIQASIVLMSSNRQQEIDRRRFIEMSERVNDLDEILEDFLKEQEEK